MTAKQLARMRQGRERAAEERRRREDDLLGEYRTWLALESSTYADLLRAREMFGSESVSADTAIAYTEWRHAVSMMPELPPKGAFERERNELPTEIEVNHA